MRYLDDFLERQPRSVECVVFSVLAVVVGVATGHSVDSIVDHVMLVVGGISFANVVKWFGRRRELQLTDSGPVENSEH